MDRQRERGTDRQTGKQTANTDTQTKTDSQRQTCRQTERCEPRFALFFSENLRNSNLEACFALSISLRFSEKF